MSVWGDAAHAVAGMPGHHGQQEVGRLLPQGLGVLHPRWVRSPRGVRKDVGAPPRRSCAALCGSLLVLLFMHPPQRFVTRQERVPGFDIRAGGGGASSYLTLVSTGQKKTNLRCVATSQGQCSPNANNNQQSHPHNSQILQRNIKCPSVVCQNVAKRMRNK